MDWLRDGDIQKQSELESKSEWSRYTLRIKESIAVRHLEFLLVYYSVQVKSVIFRRIVASAIFIIFLLTDYEKMYYLQC